DNGKGRHQCKDGGHGCISPADAKATFWRLITGSRHSRLSSVGFSGRLSNPTPRSGFGFLFCDDCLVERSGPEAAPSADLRKTGRRTAVVASRQSAIMLLS